MLSIAWGSESLLFITKELSFTWRMCWGPQSPCPLEDSLYSSTSFLTQVTSSRLQNVLPTKKYFLAACGLSSSPWPRRLSGSARAAWAGISSSTDPSLLMQLNSCDDLLAGNLWMEVILWLNKTTPRGSLKSLLPNTVYFLFHCITEGISHQSHRLETSA